MFSMLKLRFHLAGALRRAATALTLGAQKRELRLIFVRSALVLTEIGIAIGLGAGGSRGGTTHEIAALWRQPS